MKKNSVIVLGLVLMMLLTIAGCGNPKTGIDLREEGMVMKIPLKPIEGNVFMIDQIKGGGFKFEDKSYDIDSVIEALDGKPFLARTGVCLSIVTDMIQESQIVDRFALFCVRKNINLFVKVPHKPYIAKPENINWIVQRRQ